TEMKKWPNGNDVIVVISRNSPLTMQVVGRLGHMSEEAARSFIAAHKESFILADSDAALLRIVETTPGAVGIVDVHAIQNSQVRVLKVDGRLPLERDYLPASLKSIGTQRQCLHFCEVCSAAGLSQHRCLVKLRHFPQQQAVASWNQLLISPPGMHHPHRQVDPQ